MSFIYKNKLSCGFIKGVSGGCFVLINKLCYPQSGSGNNFVEVILVIFVHFFPITSAKNLQQFFKTGNDDLFTSSLTCF